MEIFKELELIKIAKLNTGLYSIKKFQNMQNNGSKNHNCIYRKMNWCICIKGKGCNYNQLSDKKITKSKNGKIIK